MTPSWPRSRRLGEELRRGALCGVLRGRRRPVRRTRIGSGTSRARAACRSATGRSSRSRPSTDSSVEEDGRTPAAPPRAVGDVHARADPAARCPGRRRGLSSSSRAITSPSRMNRSPAPTPVRPSDQFGQPVGDVVQGARVDPHAPSPSRCTWTRMPSSFSSTAHGPSRSTASATAFALCASIGSTGRPDVAAGSPPARRGPSASSARATAPSEPPSITARRTSAGRAPAACASPSTAKRVQRALPHLPVEQPEQEVLLLLGGRGQQPAHQPPALRLGAVAGRRPRSGSAPRPRRVMVRLRGGGRPDGARRASGPAHAGAALRQPSRRGR